MKIELIIPPEAEAAHRRLRDDAGLLKALATRLDTLNEETASHIRHYELSGPRPDKLGVISGLLRNSVRRSDAIIVGGVVVSAIGSNVKYLGPHEFGFEGDVQVPGFLRKRIVKQVIFGKRRKVRAGDIEVRAHKRHLKIRARAPLRLGIEARSQKYREGLGEAFGEFYRGK